jgi:hypothetical protein
MKCEVGEAHPFTRSALHPLMEGTHDTAVIPTINTWYRFIVEVEGVGLQQWQQVLG